MILSESVSAVRVCTLTSVNVHCLCPCLCLCKYLNLCLDTTGSCPGIYPSYLYMSLCVTSRGWMDAGRPMCIGPAPWSRPSQWIPRLVNRATVSSTPTITNLLKHSVNDLQCLQWQAPCSACFEVSAYIQVTKIAWAASSTTYLTETFHLPNFTDTSSQQRLINLITASGAVSGFYPPSRVTNSGMVHTWVTLESLMWFLVPSGWVSVWLAVFCC